VLDGDVDDVRLDARMEAFLATINRERRGDLADFFPRTGTWTYVHTVRGAAGDRRSISRFPAGETPRVVGFDSPLQHVFNINYHGQPIGRLVHQVMHRRTGWRRVSPLRFAPQGETRDAAIFVEWRREGDTWVISAVGDESYDGVELPAWCC
jgi:hypothetical protein